MGTFCKGKFDCKVDWMHHENSEHHHREAWKRDEVVNPDKKCDGRFSRLERFIHHVVKYHEINIAEYDPNARRNGSSFRVQFWCGFCKDDIELKRRGVDSRLA
jgi:hypothetical protein